MLEEFRSRLYHAWNAFNQNGNYKTVYRDIGPSISRPSRTRLAYTSEKSSIASMCNRIAIDVASTSLKHVRVDDNGRYVTDIDSKLNRCLVREANKDQGARQFIMDVVLSMLDEGCVAIVPVDTTMNPNVTGSYDILTMRTGKILEWYPDHVRIRVYNDKTGQTQDILMKKSAVAIVENPLYAVMNEPNSTLKRLVRKINLLDQLDDKIGSNKLDLIIQLPYAVKNEIRREKANERLSDLEAQLEGSKYGIGNIDAQEHVTQLNRSVDNNLLEQMNTVKADLYNQLGISEGVFDGTADDTVMMNYYNRTTEPILGAIAEAMNRSFITETAWTQGQRIMYFNDPFKLIPISQMAELADKFTRNEILSSNEIRVGMGIKPSEDPKADQLINSNLNQAQSMMQEPYYDEQNQNGSLEDEYEQEY